MRKYRTKIVFGDLDENVRRSLLLSPLLVSPKWSVLQQSSYE